MTTPSRLTSALVFDGSSAVRVGGLTLTERAVLLAHRAGLRPVRVSGAQALSLASVQRLGAHGVTAIQVRTGAPLAGVGAGESVVVLGPDLLAEPALLSFLLGRAEGSEDDIALVVRESTLPLLVVLPPTAVADVRACTSATEMVTLLAARGRVRDLPVPHHFFRRVATADDAPRAARDYLRKTNGGAGESFFTKIIRRFSVPFSIRLTGLGVTPTQVTSGGLVLAILAGWCLSRGSYEAGLLGAGLYYASMIFDCSDGEVARLTLRDSPFGAWLETMVDYLTYVLVLGGLAVAGASRPDADAILAAAFVAAAGSIVVAAVATYLRHRVTPTDPGQFDESSAHVLSSAGPLQRFASWNRQWIKRSSIAHLLVVLALTDLLDVLIYLWAFGASLAAVVILAVAPFVVRRVGAPPAVRHSSARSR